jgi:hypothetical protein
MYKVKNSALKMVANYVCFVILLILTDFGAKSLPRIKMHFNNASEARFDRA